MRHRNKVMKMNSYDFSDMKINVDEWDAYTGRKQWNAVYTIQIGELIASGIFDWSNELLNWKDAAFDDEQYERICKYFVERFYYREISLEPFREWARTLRRKLVFELMPKYKPLYERIAEGINPLSDSNEYYKNRTIDSAYPQTMLSGNSDYVTDGRDEEFERIKEGNFVDSVVNYAEKYRSVDELLLNDLESMFICMYTADFNATW